MSPRLFQKAQVETVNLNFPGEESIEAVIARYRGDKVFLREDSGLFEGLGFPEQHQIDGTYRIGVIRRPRESRFSFETPPNRLLGRANVTLHYSDVRAIIVEETYLGRKRVIRFIS